jgi:hypothetical protein
MRLRRVVLVGLLGIVGVIVQAHGEQPHGVVSRGPRADPRR